jgi:hypothetical protein
MSERIDPVVFIPMTLNGNQLLTREWPVVCHTGCWLKKSQKEVEQRQATALVTSCSQHSNSGRDGPSGQPQKGKVNQPNMLEQSVTESLVVESDDPSEVVTAAVERMLAHGDVEIWW